MCHTASEPSGNREVSIISRILNGEMKSHIGICEGLPAADEHEEGYQE